MSTPPVTIPKSVPYTGCPHVPQGFCPTCAMGIAGGHISVHDGSRLALAKAALEDAVRANDIAWKAHVATCSALGDAQREVNAAEREAAQPPIPPALLEVAREVLRDDPYQLYGRGHMLSIAARSHSIDPARLRDRLEAKP